MIKKLTLLILLGIVTFSLFGCGSGEVKQVDYKQVEDLFSNDTGYLLIYIDDDNNYLTTLKDVSIKKNKDVLLYNPYKKDGENENNQPLYPEEEVKGNALYYIENGDIKTELDIEKIEETKLSKEIEIFME